MNEKELTRVRNTAYRLLTYRPRSRAELETKLRDRDIDDGLIRQVMDDLVRLGYVNDLRFAEQWTSSRIRLRGFGRRRIALELRNKGVDPEIIREALAEACTAESEIETAQKAAEKKLRTMRATEPESRRRTLAGFLERKGFSSEIIFTVLRQTECSH